MENYFLLFNTPSDSKNIFLLHEFVFFFMVYYKEVEDQEENKILI